MSNLHTHTFEHTFLLLSYMIECYFVGDLMSKVMLSDCLLDSALITCESSVM